MQDVGSVKKESDMNTTLLYEEKVLYLKRGCWIKFSLQLFASRHDISDRSRRKNCLSKLLISTALLSATKYNQINRKYNSSGFSIDENFEIVM